MIDLNEYIEDYWDGNLGGEKLQAFVQKMDTDEDFKEQIMLYQEIRESLRNDLAHKNKQESLKSTLDRYTGKYFRPKMTKPGKGFNLKAFGVLLLVFILVLALIFLFWPYGNSPQFEDSFSFPVAGLTVKGEGNSDLTSKAEKAFNSGNYEGALEAFGKLKTQNPGDPEIIFFESLSQLETGNFEAAISGLKFLSNGTGSYGFDGEWYLALAYYKAGNREEALNTLSGIDPTSPYYKQAEELLENEKLR